MQWNGLYKERNPTERGDKHLTRERERESIAPFYKHVTLIY